MSEKQITNLNSALNLLSEIKNCDFDQKDLENISSKIKTITTILDEIKKQNKNSEWQKTK